MVLRPIYSLRFRDVEQYEQMQHWAKGIGLSLNELVLQCVEGVAGKKRRWLRTKTVEAVGRVSLMGLRSDGQIYQVYGDRLGGLREELDEYLNHAPLRPPMSLDEYWGQDGWVEEKR